MVKKFGKWNWRDVYRLPAAMFLGLLVSRNYAMRKKGMLPDEWYWADRVIFAWGYVEDFP